MGGVEKYLRTLKIAVGAMALIVTLAIPAAAGAEPSPPAAPDGQALVEFGDPAAFTFDDTIGGDVDHFLCTLEQDPGAPTLVDTTDPCTSPVSYSGLAPGNYVFKVKAVDDSGNESLPNGMVFTVINGVAPTGSSFSFNGPADSSILTAPVTGFSGTMDTTFIGSGPDFFWHNYQQEYNVEIWRVLPDLSLVVQAEFHESFAGLCFGCSNINWNDTTPPAVAPYVVTKSGSLPSLDGQYRIRAGQQATGPSGLADIADVRNITIDTTDPQTIGLTPPPAGSNTSPVFTFNGNDPNPTDGLASGIDHFECSINGGAWQVCQSGDPLWEAAPEGNNTFKVRAIDRAGNIDQTPASTNFIVDLTPPEITIVKPVNKDRYLLHHGPAVNYQCVDPLVGVPPATPGASGIASCVATPINDEDLGPHYFQVVATDHAGHTSSKKVAYTTDPPGYGGFVAEDRPLAYYRLNEPVGSADMLDSSGNNHHGIYQNGIALGRSGATACERRPHPPRACELAGPAENKAGYFPARDGHGYVNGITAPTSGYTMEAWVKPRDGADMMVMSHGGGGQLFIKNGKLAFRQVQDTIQSNAAVPAGSWSHVAATWNGSVTRLFVNGVQVASSTTANKAPSGTATFYVGYGEMALWFHGDLDEVAYYGKALSQHRLFDRWKIGSAKDHPSLEAGNSPFNTEGPFTDPVAPKNGGLYAPTKVPDADFTCTDPDDQPGDSDVASCTAEVDGNPILSGDPLPDSLGTHTFTVTVIDKGGNQYVHSHTYTVKGFEDLFNTDSPIAYYRLGDATDSPMVDASGNDHHGTYKNAQESGPVGISGDGDHARWFYGESGYGYVNDVAAPRYQATMEAWVHPADARDQSIVGHGDAGEIYIKDGHFKFRRMGETVTSSTPVAVGAWQQVVGTWDGADIRIYVDGIETGKVESTRRPSSISTLYVGFGELAPWFYGVIDEVAYYPVALDANRVYQHWLADPPPDAGVSVPPSPDGSDPVDLPGNNPGTTTDEAPEPDAPVSSDDPTVGGTDDGQISALPGVETRDSVAAKKQAAKLKAKKKAKARAKCNKKRSAKKRRACLRRVNRS